jgi:D-threonine aldolase
VTTTRDLTTPTLLLDRSAFQHNVALMADRYPGPRLRPHVKAHKSTAIGRAQLAAGHRSFTCATIREMEGFAAAGLGEDLLLANEVADARRLGSLVEAGARITLAVDSEETIRIARRGGVREVLIDVNVGLPRCGCAPLDAGRLADTARSAGLHVRGVMGYEGHLMMVGENEKRAKVEQAMALLLQAHEFVGGDLVSAGGTGTHLVNTWANEIQAGSYVLLDSQYATLDQGFKQALWVESTVISVNREGGFAVADAGLKAFGMDHGNPRIPDADVWFCSDEHMTFRPHPDGRLAKIAVGDRVRIVPAHCDPTVAYHDRYNLIEDAGTPDSELVDVWPIDLRGW